MSLHFRGLLLPEDVVRDVFVSDGRITFTPVEGARTVSTDGVMLPGLVDAHAHLQLFSPAGDDAPVSERVRASARAQLAAGVLVLRDPGAPTDELSLIGPADGLPRGQFAGRFIAPPCGYIPGFSVEAGDDELPDAVEAQARAGGGWVKVIGDFFDLAAGMRRNYSDQALRAAAERAHAAGARITTHAFMPEVIVAAAEAGFDCIEHATLLEPGIIPLLLRHNVAVCPTLSIDALVPDFVRAFGIPESDVARVEEAVANHPDLVRQAAEAGVTILAGTDAGMVPHGQIVGEIALLFEAGLPPAQAVAAGSWAARTYLGYPGIEEGAPADLAVFREDPREQPKTLEQPLALVLDGRLVTR